MSSLRRTYLGWLPAAVVMIGSYTACSRALDQAKGNQIDTVTLQYRIAKDAFAPSKFVAVIGDGMSPPLELIWDLSKPDVQGTTKTEFDALIQSLEAKGVNGVEFECRGEWVQQGTKLRITTVPELTAVGRKRIQESNR